MNVRDGKVLAEVRGGEHDGKNLPCPSEGSTMTLVRHLPNGSEFHWIYEVRGTTWDPKLVLVKTKIVH